MIMCDINLTEDYRARLIHHVNAIPFQVFVILFHFHKSEADGAILMKYISLTKIFLIQISLKYVDNIFCRYSLKQQNNTRSTMNGCIARTFA